MKWRNKVKENALLLILFITTFGIAMAVAYDTSKDGEYEREYEKDHYNNGSLVSVIDIRDGMVSLSVQGEKLMMKENETYEMNNHTNSYIGSIEIIEIKENSVLVDVNAEKTGYYYIMNILIGFTISLIVVMFVMWPHRVANN